MQTGMWAPNSLASHQIAVNKYQLKPTMSTWWCWSSKTATNKIVSWKNTKLNRKITVQLHIKHIGGKVKAAGACEMWNAGSTSFGGPRGIVFFSQNLMPASPVRTVWGPTAGVRQYLRLTSEAIWAPAPCDENWAVFKNTVREEKRNKLFKPSCRNGKSNKSSVLKLKLCYIWLKLIHVDKNIFGFQSTENNQIVCLIPLTSSLSLTAYIAGFVGYTGVFPHSVCLVFAT